MRDTETRRERRKAAAKPKPEKPTELRDRVDAEVDDWLHDIDDALAEASEERSET